MSDVDELRALAKQLDPSSPSESRVEIVRAQLLRAAVEDRHEVATRWPFVVGGFTAGALAAAAAAMVVMHSGHPATSPVARGSGELRAQIEASSAADFERQVTHGAKGTDEIVRLHTGRISLAVDDLPSGDHVRVAAKNGEIEGSGLYEVAVVDDAIQEVIVKEGGASVRIIGQQNVFLAAGQAWKAPVVTADVTLHATPTPPTIAPLATPSTATPPTTVAPIVRAPSHRATEMIRTPTPHTILAPSPVETKPSVPPLQTMADASPGEAPAAESTQIAKPEKKTTALEQHFASGWQLLRAGKDAEAARELAAAADAGGDDPLAGDARYFQAIALTKAGRKTEAEHALVAFLDRSPHALRRGRAAVMLGRLIAERGDSTTAKTWFESASRDPDPTVATAARAELSKLK